MPLIFCVKDKQYKHLNIFNKCSKPRCYARMQKNLFREIDSVTKLNARVSAECPLRVISVRSLSCSECFAEGPNPPAPEPRCAETIQSSSALRVYQNRAGSNFSVINNTQLFSEKYSLHLTKEKKCCYFCDFFIFV